jgi:hypothetical protein
LWVGRGVGQSVTVKDDFRFLVVAWVVSMVKQLNLTWNGTLGPRKIRQDGHNNYERSHGVVAAHQ